MHIIIIRDGSNKYVNRKTLFVYKLVTRADYDCISLNFEEKKFFVFIPF